MKRVRLGVICLFCWWLTGCATHSQLQDIKQQPLLHDELFPRFSAVDVVSEKQIFELSDDVKAFVDTQISPRRSFEGNVRNLIHGIFDRSTMGLLYKGDANTTATETYRNRSANCLSLSIMTYAMAEHAGFDASFYEVDIPEYWTRRDGYSFINGHINLRIVEPEESNVVRIKDDYMNVDFDPQMFRQHFPTKRVTKDLVVAMFYNNYGADAIAANDYDKAYAYFRAATLLAPELDQTWVNLGILYRFRGGYQQAEKSYRYALSLNEENLTGWENLAVLYMHMGKQKKAAEIVAKVNKRRRDNPFYHFILGEEALEAELYTEALEHYERARRLNRTQHEILFGLGKAYFELGDISSAKRYLELAAQHAPNKQDQQRYSSKLSMLRSSR